MTVEVTKDGPVTTIGINRPEVRNAVDRATAEALVAAFEEFDADPVAAVAGATRFAGGAGRHGSFGTD